MERKRCTANKLLIKNIQIYAENEMIETGYIKIAEDKIVEMGSVHELKEDGRFGEIIIPKGYKIIPGLIDVHIHGVDGADTMDGTTEALDTMAKALPKEGTTSFLATTITQDKEAIEKALVNVSRYCSMVGKAEVLGLHLEGPFINRKMAGAQPVNHIINPEIALFKKWQKLSRDSIRIVTLAPELPGALELIKYLIEQGIVASIGHSDATYEDVTSAIRVGATQVTHLFNQMRGLHHREPGVVGAALLHQELRAELIVDGIHVDPEIVKLAYRQKDTKGLILITDSMRAKCLKNGSYDLGGQEVQVSGGKAILKDGTLAGSILKLSNAVKNIMEYADCTLADAVEMASVNPAKQLNLFDCKGSIEIGKDADLVILDDKDDVFMTFCRGKLAFKKEGMGTDETKSS